MNYISDFHTHSSYCDGKASMREMVKSAIAKGCRSYGFSSHSPMVFNCNWCIKESRLDSYFAEIESLKAEFKDEIELYSGIEADLFTLPLDESKLDYIIGSLHFVKTKNGLFDVDHSAAMQQNTVKTEFNGDFYAYCENYYELLLGVPSATHADIIGHFDLVTKFNEDGSLFDESHPRYRTAALTTLSELAKKDVLFEINTGAMSRKYRLSPYPAEFILKELYALGGKIVINSDAHRPENICAFFDDAVNYVKSCGFSSAVTLCGGEFKEYSL